MGSWNIVSCKVTALDLATSLTQIGDFVRRRWPDKMLNQLRGLMQQKHPAPTLPNKAGPALGV